MILTAALASSCPAAVFSVTNTADGGSGTLREAILSANGIPGLDVIEFDLAGAGPHTLAPVTELPAVTDPVVIDGTAQPGYAGSPMIRLVGTNNMITGGNLYNGLLIQGGNSTVRGLAIEGFINGIWVELRGSNAVERCFIGTDVSGTNGLGNTKYGISIQNTPHNRIGGTNSGDGNLISNNGEVGVLIFGNGSQSNVVAGNLIGTTIAGTEALGVQTNGVYLHSAPGNLVGGAAAGASNVISGNGHVGVYVYGTAATGNRVQGNYIGTDPSGTLAVSNGLDGVLLQEAPGNMVGGAELGAANVISGNGERGVVIFGPNATGNEVQGNRIGTDRSGLLPLGNQFSGVGIFGARNNLIGGASEGAGNVISANQESGVLITTNGAANNRIEGNLIGVDATGTNAMGNVLNGVSIDNGANNVVGGLAAAARNLISGNAQHGVYIVSPGSSGNTVAGNFIGLDLTGHRALSNALTGVRITSSANLIGGAAPAARNVISGNGETGVMIVGANASGNFVQGNFIGTDVTGTAKLGNGKAGVGLSDAAHNYVGGANYGASGPGAGNLVSGNNDAGIFLIGEAATGNQVFGNYVGTDVTGSSRLGNLYEGIYLERASSNLIGGTYGNLVAGNAARGLFLTNASGNTIEGNLIGTKSDGVSDLGHPYHAVELEQGSDYNTIGGLDGGGNRIAFTPQYYAGVRVRDGCAGNRILSNLIFRNGSLGIDLGPYGVTPNDDCDTDTGANNLQNYPVLTLAASGAGETLINGILPTGEKGAYLVQFFANPVPHPTGHGEGEMYLGSTTVSTVSDCLAAFSLRLPVDVPAGYSVAATATDEDDNTSEFSAGVTVILIPTLTIFQTANDRITLAWPAASPSYRIEETRDLRNPVEWTQVTGIPLVMTNGQVTVSIETTNRIGFYRLVYP